MKELFNIFVWQKLIWATQTINVWVLQGYSDETTSSNCYRQKDHPIFGKMFTCFYKGIDWLFRDPEHCKKSYLVELEKKASWEKHSGN